VLPIAAPTACADGTAAQAFAASMIYSRPQALQPEALE